VLAAAEADLEAQLGKALPQGRDVLRPADAQAGQQGAQQLLLAGAQALALAPPEERPLALGRRVGNRGQARAVFSSGARSVRSQEKLPSFCGGRPKCP